MDALRKSRDSAYCRKDGRTLKWRRFTEDHIRSQSLEAEVD